MFGLKHQQYCYNTNLPPAAISLWQWLLANQNDDCYELDLFNQWVAEQRGRGYHRDTLKSAIAQLENAGIITTVKRFSWKIIRGVLHPIHKLLTKESTPRKNSLPCGEIRKKDASNPDKAAAEVLQQQLDICEQAGIHYPSGQREWLIAFSLQDLLEAIAYLVIYSEQNTVRNPAGFVRRCLEQGWELKPSHSNYSSFINAYQNLIEDMRSPAVEIVSVNGVNIAL